MRLRGWVVAASRTSTLTRFATLAGLAGLAGVAVPACTHDFGAFEPPGDGSHEDAARDDGGAADGASVDAGTGDGAAEDVAGEGGTCTENGAIQFLGRCYFPLSNRQSWSSASAACQAASAHLVTLGSADEQTAVQAILPGDDRWIGLDRPLGSAPGDASFTWTTDEPRAYANWAAGEPNGSGECARMKAGSGQWADMACGGALRAVCERY